MFDLSSLLICVTFERGISMESQGNANNQPINNQPANTNYTHLPSTNNTPMFHDADELLASMQGQGLVNLNEGANFLGFLTSSK